MMRLTAPLLFFALGLSAACGGGSDNATADAPVLSGDKYSLTWGPVNVPAGVEDTQCIWVRLSNTTEIKVHQMHNVLTESSHHLIIYKDDKDTVEQTTPMPCRPFTGTLNTTGMIAPLAITQKLDDPIFLPDGVAYTFPANQMIKLELHYINRSDSAENISATVDFYSADPSTIHDEAAILFTGSPDVKIPAGMSGTLHQFFTVPANLDLSKAKIFAITGHTHQYGTDVKVGVGAGSAGPFTMVYDPKPFNWAEPETAVQDPPFSVPVGGGMDFECDWTNTSSQEVSFGESANDEMCFFWAYYYPSQGSKVCFHTNQYGGAAGTNVCCPGDSLCSFLDMYL
jgi:hypothetical protein